MIGDRTYSRPLLNVLLFICCAVPESASLGSEDQPPGVIIQTKKAPLDFLIQKLRDGHQTMPREEYDRIISRLNARARRPSNASVRVGKANYLARYENGVLVGTGSLQILATEPADLPWRANLAISQPTWESTGAPATLGASDNATLLRVSQSDDMNFDWTIRADDQRFTIELPSASLSNLQLQLPATLRPVASKGIVIPPTNDGVITGPKTWNIELGGHTSIQIELRSIDQRDEPIEIRDKRTRVIVTRMGVDITFVVALRTTNSRHLVFRTHQKLHIRDVRAHNQTLNWSVLDQEAGVRLLTVELSADTNLPAELTIIAGQPLTVDESWLLPELDLVGAGWWQERLDLFVPMEMQVAWLDISGGQVRNIQSRREAIRYRIQFDQPATSVRAKLVYRKPNLNLKILDELTLGAGAITADTHLIVESSGGPAFSLNLPISDGWSVDSVESQPAQLVDQMLVETKESELDQLRVELESAVGGGEPVRLRIRSRRTELPNYDSFSADDLQPFRPSMAVKRWVMLSTNEPYQLALLSDGGTAWSTTLPAEFGVNPADNAWLFQPTQRARPTFSRTVLNEGELSANVEIAAQVEKRALVETYRIECQPTSTPLATISLVFDHPRATSMQWKIEGSDDPLEALWDDDGSHMSNGAAVQLELPSPMNERFVLLSEHRTWTNKPTAVGLVQILDASLQQGIVRVSANGGIRPRVETNLLKVPPGEHPRGQVAVYQYSIRDIFAETPAIRVGPSSTSHLDNLANAWIVDCELESRFATDGLPLHRAIYNIAAHGQATISLKMPSGCSLHRVALNDIAQDVDKNLTEFDVTLSGESPATLAVEFSSTWMALPRLGRVASFFPTTNLPVTRRSWRLWLPRQFRPVESDSAVAAIDRLAGPFRSRPNESVFWLAPLRVWSFISNQRGAGISIPDAARMVVQEMGVAKSDWSEFALADTVGPSSSVQLFVDAEALARSGLYPDTPFPSVDRNRNDFERGLELLRRHQLMILVGEQGLVLTTAERVASFFEEIRSTEFGSIAILRPGKLNRWVDLAIEQRLSPDSGPRQPTSPFVTAIDWTTLPQSTRFLDQSDTEAGELLHSGWTLHVVDVPEAQTSVLIHEPGYFQIIAYVIYLSSVVVLRPITAGRGHFSLAITAMIGVSVMLLPDPYIAWATAAFWGSITCLVINLIRSRNPVFHTQAAVVSLAICASLVGISPNSLQAETTSRGLDPADVPPVSPRSYEVFIPLEDGKEGNVVFVPNEFYQWMMRVSESTDQFNTAIVRSADYDATMPTPDCDSVTIVAGFQVQSSGDTLLRWPSAIGSVESAHVDGWKVATKSTDDAIDIPITGRGNHEVKLRLSVDVVDDGSRRTVQLPIPPVPDSTVILSLPQGVRDVRFPMAQGAIRRLPRRVEARFGSNDTLEFSWDNDKVTVEPNVDRVTTVQISTRGIMVHISLQPINGTRIDRPVLLRVSPELLLVNQQQPAEIPLGQRQPDVIEADWDGTAAYSASFQLAGHSGVGRIVIPDVEVQNAAIRRDVIGYAVSPDLSIEVTDAGDFSGIRLADSPNQFSDPAAIDFAMERTLTDRTRSDSYPITRTSFSTTKREVGTALRVNFGSEHAAYEFAVELQNGSRNDSDTANQAALKRFKIQSDPTWTVDQVKTSFADAETVASYTLDSRGMITIPIPLRLGTLERIVVRGRHEKGAHEFVALPNLVPQQANALDQRIDLYADETVTLESTQNNAFQTIDPGSSATSSRQPGFFRRFVPSRQGALASEISVRTRPNSPEFDAKLETHVVRNEDKWALEFKLNITKLRGGQLRTMRFVFPESWRNRLDSIGDTQIAFSECPLQDTVYVDVMLRDPTIREVTLRSLQATESFPLAIPNPTIVGAQKLERFVHLPESDGDQSLDWHASGAKPIIRITNQISDETTAVRNRVYEVIDGTTETIRGSPKSMENVPEVHLCDVRVQLEQARFHGQISYDLHPSTLQTCQIRTPNGCELVSVLLDGAPTLTEQASPNEWTVHVSPFAPQRITVHFFGSRPVNRTTDLPVPTLCNGQQVIEVKSTLWTIQTSSPSMHISWPGERPVSEARMAVERATAVSELVRKTDHTMFRQVQPGDWYRPWLRRFSTAVHRARSSSSTLDPAAVVELESRLAALESDQATAAETHGMTAAFEQRDQDYESSLIAISPIRQHYAFVGEMPTARLENHAVHDQQRIIRFGMAVGLLAVAFVAVRRDSRNQLALTARRWLPGFVALAGIAWYLWLTPSIVGLFIAGLAVIASIRTVDRWGAT